MNAWHGPTRPGEYPSLGYQVIDWIEANRTDRHGRPLLLTAEQQRFLLEHYRLDLDGQFTSELAAAMGAAERAGPVAFAGWDAQGEPTATPAATREWADLHGSQAQQD